MANKVSIFFSYRGKDSEIVEPIFRALERRKAKAWLYLNHSPIRHQVSPQRLAAELTKAIGEMEVFAPFVTPNYLSTLDERGDACAFELRTALNLGKKVLPLSYNGTQLPGIIANWGCYNLYPDDIESAAFALIAGALRATGKNVPQELIGYQRQHRY